jgi:tetratricopeptide (TPR) repeat protein
MKRTGMLAVAWAGLLALSAGCAGYAFEARPEDIPTLEVAVERAPRDAMALTRLGAAYHAADRFEEARVTLRRAIEGGGADGSAHLYLGLANEGMEDWTAARAAYQNFLDGDGSSRLRNQIRARLAVVSRQELRQIARETLRQETQLSEQPATPNTVAVMPFHITGLSEELQPLRTALADMIITDLSFTPVRSVERVRMQSMIDEMLLTQAGYTTPETGARMGRLLRAEHVVQGLISGSDAELALDATVLHTERRTAAGELNHRGQIDAIFNLQKQLVYSILDALGVVPTDREREAIEGNRTGNLIAFVTYGRGLEALDRGDYAAALSHFRQAATLDPSFRSASVQSVQAEELASAPAATEVGVGAVAEIGAPVSTQMTQAIIDQVNPSPATAFTSTESTAGSGSQEANSVVESNPTTPLSQAIMVRVIISALNPLRNR